MAQVKLEKGEKKELPDTCRNLEIGLRWDIPADEAGVDLDSCILMFSEDGELLDHVSYQKMKSTDGAVQLMGDNTSGKGTDGGDNETIRIVLADVSPQVKTLVCGVACYSGGKTFDNVDAVNVTLRQFVDTKESCFPCIKGPSFCGCLPRPPKAHPCNNLLAPLTGLSSMFKKCTNMFNCCPSTPNLDGFFGSSLPAGEDAYTGMVALKIWRDGPPPEQGCCNYNQGKWKAMQINHKEQESAAEGKEEQGCKGYLDLVGHAAEVVDSDFSASDLGSEEDESS